MKCINCNQECLSIKSVIRHGKVYTGCENCIVTLVQGNENAANYNRERMKRDYASDIVQPINPREYIKARGIEESKQFYNDETIRKFS